jgi:hypothetical protein
VNGLYVAAVCFGWITLFLVFARRTYRREYAAHIERQSSVYGRTTPERARRRALDEAYEMIYKWPAVLIFGLFDWVITSEHLLGVPDSVTDPWAQPPVDPTDELIARLDKELNPSGAVIRTCPCGYRTECPIHCGNGHETGRCPHREGGPPKPPATPGVRYDAP